MMFLVSTNCFRNLLGFFVGNLFSFIVTNIFVFLHTFLFVFIVTNLWLMVIIGIVSMGSLSISCFMFRFLMANPFLDVIANLFRNILTFLDLLGFNDGFVNSLVMGLTLFFACLFVGILLVTSNFFLVWFLIL